jgi:hypothetical protein
MPVVSPGLVGPRSQLLGPVALALSLFVGIALRAWVAFVAGGKHWSDSAIIGLMAMHTLRGHFYPFYWGQAYMGSIESLGVVPFFALFGVSGVTLCLGLLPWYVVFTVALYLVVRRAGGPLAASVAAWLSALAPPYVQYQEIMPRGDYPETLALGTLLLWLTLRIVYDPLSRRAKDWHLIVLAFVAGLAFWTNWLVFPYFAVVCLYLLLDDWRTVLRPAMPGAFGAFFIGSFPFWLFNFRNGFPSFSFLDSLQEPAGRAVALHYALEGALPQLLGFRDLDGEFAFGWPGRILTGAAAIGILCLVVGLRRSWIALARGRIREASPIVALLLLPVAGVAIYSMSLPGRFHVARYLLPLVTSTLALMALAVAWLAGRSRRLAAMALCGLTALYGVEIAGYRQGFVTARGRPGAGPVDGLARYLLHTPIRFGYADYGDATITTFLSGDRIVLTDYYGARYPLEEVEFADPALIVRDDGSANKTLKALDAEFSAKHISGYRIYWPIRYDGIPRAPLPRGDWHATANVAPQDASLAIDRDRWSYWSTTPTVGHSDAPPPAFTLDLGSTISVNGLALDAGERDSDTFHRLRIEVSNDGQDWKLLEDVTEDFAVYFDENGQITTRPSSVQYVLFQPVATRWLRLALLEGTAGFNWSVGELTVFGPGQGGKLLETANLADPRSRELTERRLWQQVERDADADAPLLALRALYRSLGEVDGVSRVDRLRAARFRPETSTAWAFGSDLELVGYDWRVLGGRRFRITYYWRAKRAMTTDYALYLHLTGDRGRFQDDCLLGAPHSTRSWQTGEVIKQSRTIIVPVTVPSGAYVAKLGVWDPATRHHLRMGFRGWWGPREKTLLGLRVEDEQSAAVRN